MSALARGWDRARCRQWLGPTDAPAKWGLAAATAAGLTLGAAAGAAVPPARGAILSGLTAALVAAAVATGTGPIGAALGVLGLLAYVLAVALSTMASLRPTVSFASGVFHIGLGCVAGMLVTLAAAGVRRARHHDGSVTAVSMPPLWRPMVRSLRTFDEHARDGVRRALPLAAGVYLFESSGSRDALWIFVAAFVVLLPAGKPPLAVMATRILTTIVAVLVLGLLTLVVAHEVLFGMATGAILAGIAYGDRYPLPASSATTMGAILFAAAPSGAIRTWATHRLLDTLLGCGLAFAATYLLWPRDRPETAPAMASPS